MTGTCDNAGNPVLPPGLKLACEILTPKEERELIALIESSGLTYIDYDPGNRRASKVFGWEYNFHDDTVWLGAPLPEDYYAIRDRAAAFGGIEPDAVVEFMLIRYDPGSYIQPHCDRPTWEHVIGISLGAAITMEFSTEDGAGSEPIAVELPPRSAYLLSGDARHVYRHAIPCVRETRWSITLRDFSDKGIGMRDNALAAGV